MPLTSKDSKEVTKTIDNIYKTDGNIESNNRQIMEENLWVFMAQQGRKEKDPYHLRYG